MWLWVKWNEISGDLSVTLSQSLQCSVKQDSDVIGGCLHDLRDLLVTEIILEFKLNHFLLPGRQRTDDPQQEPGRFLLFELVKRHGLLAFARFNHFLVDVDHAPFFSAHVEGRISANRKQPGRRFILAPSRAVKLKLDECLLNNISRLFPVTSYALSVLKQRNLESMYDFLEFLPFSCSAASHRIWCLSDERRG